MGLPPRVAAGFGAALLALVVAGGALTYALTSRSANGERFRRTNGALHAMHELEAALVVSGTTLERYLDTGDPAQRARYARASATAAGALGRLEGAISEEPTQQARFARLGRLVRILEAQQARLAALRDREQPVPPAVRARSGVTAALREAQDLVGDLQDGEAEVLHVREAALRRAVRRSYAVGAAAEVALLVLVVVAARAVRAEIRRRDAERDEKLRMLELQKTLMAIVGHDLRTPLAGIAWNAALLGRSPLAAGDQRLVRRIGASARRMERLIRDVLDYGRVHAGAGIPLAPAPGDLAAICGEVVDEIQDPAHPIALAVKGDTSGAWDADRIEQMVANLVSNALKYGPPGRPVQVRVEGIDGWARIAVHDEGGGLPEVLGHGLFEPFRRGEGVSGKGGLGLGLFIVRTLAEAHGGAVAVDSCRERGTTFTVSLPRLPAPDAPAVDARAPAAPHLVQ